MDQEIWKLAAKKMTAATENEWWKSATIYEIAPISFQDSNGDGKGDLAGLLRRIEYLKELGIDAIWLTPICKSPFRDLGYDIATIVRLIRRSETSRSSTASSPHCMRLASG